MLKSGRTSVTVIGDMGSFFFYGKKDALIGWEIELARRFEIDLKGFCLYHMQDFKRLSKIVKQKLYQHHTRTLHLLPCPIGS